MTTENLNALFVFLSAFGVAAFAGLATFLRFARKITWLSVLSAMLNAGSLGLAIGLIWYRHFCREENISGLIGICALAGMGGSTLSDVFWSILSGAGVKVIITHERNPTFEDADEEKPHD
jgi:hypothetical protein